jgi:hypothetical protein
MGKAAQSDGRPRGLVRYWWVAVLVIAIVTGTSFGWRLESQPAGSSGKMIAGTNVASAARRETRPTLDPDRFVGKAREAHRVAREIPDVLDQLYCYCECDKHVGHKSLLSCYTDGHAAT